MATKKASGKPAKKAGAKKAAAKRTASKVQFTPQFVNRLLARIRFNEDRIKRLEDSIGQAPPTGTPILP